MKFQLPKGMRDFLPEEMLIRQKILEKIRQVFESYSFVPLETPAIENWDILATKGAGGEEILKETYNFKDKGGRKLGLKYDLTVPLARVIAMNPNLPLPFKRYQIEKVWRYGDVTKDRLREFWQADIDIVGSESMLADAEIIACTVAVFNALGFEKFVVRLNNRKILSALIKCARIREDKVMDIFRAIDKLDKIGSKNVEEELSERGIPKDIAKQILKFVKIKGKPEIVLKKAGKFVKNVKEGKEGVEELKQLISYLRNMGIKQFKIDLSLARGLDYYTGPIFEVWADEGIGSLAGGGRYDKMIGLFLKKDIPSTGISLGIERIIEVIKDKKMVKIEKTKTKVFVASVNEKVTAKTLEIAQILRKNNIAAEVELRGRSLARQLEYADSFKIPYTIIIGERELEKNMVKFRDMKKRKESEVKIDEVVKKLKRV